MTIKMNKVAKEVLGESKGLDSLIILQIHI